MSVPSKYNPVSAPRQHTESPMKRNHHGSVDGAFHLVSLESLVAMGFVGKGSSSLSPTKSWQSLAGFSEASTVSLTDCSSRSSLQDLDLSFEEGELKDHLPSPAPGYWRPLSEEEGPRKNRHPFLPSVLTKSPRAVSFSSIEEVHVYSEGVDEHRRQVLPKTPAIQWYTSKASSHGPRPTKHHVPILTSGSPMRKPPLPPMRLQPKRSALKKPESVSRTRNLSSPPKLPSPQYPSSPKVTYYSSKK